MTPFGDPPRVPSLLLVALVSQASGCPPAMLDPIVTGSTGATDPTGDGVSSSSAPTSSASAGPDGDPSSTAGPSSISGDPGATGTGTDGVMSTGTDGVMSTGSGGADTSMASTGTGDVSTADASSEPGGSSSGTTTGGDATCDLAGPDIDVSLVDDGAPQPACGTLEFTGRAIQPSIGPVYALDSCPCDSACRDADPWTLTIDVPDAGSLLPWMPECPRVVVERAPGPMGCELVGAAIWDLGHPEWPVRWIAGRRFAAIAAVEPEFSLASEVVATCECDGCCETPERHDLTFTSLALGDSEVVPEGETALLAMQGGDCEGGCYNAVNVRSHRSGVCDTVPAVAWVASFFFAP